MKILILGATGMLGYSLFKNLSVHSGLDVYGTVRSLKGIERFYSGLENKLFTKVDVLLLSQINSIIKDLQPNVVINCIGLIKQKSLSKQAVDAIQINSLLPHQLAGVCDEYNAKLIHFSTDCVFDGESGCYNEHDIPNAQDLYGLSKRLGEVVRPPHLTFRTSIIGHELKSSVSLIDWFLSKEGSVSGYSKAMFSGLPTCYIAKLFANELDSFLKISGLYHFSVNPISKFLLLNKVAKIYKKNITITSDDTLVIDRSLDNSKLNKEIDFLPVEWDELIDFMYKDYQNNYI